MFKQLISFLSEKLFKINDTPQKIALGVGIGVFCGLLPGPGPVASLFMAFIFRANRAAALLGGMLTNTWLSFVTFVLAIKVGSAILNLNWQDVQCKAQLLIKNFSLANFFKLSFFDVLMPLLVGYLVIGLILGILSYLITLLVIRRRFHGSKSAHL